MQSVGDMSRALVLRMNQTRLREEMDKLAVEVATGLVKDPAKHLAGDVSGLQSIDRSLARLNTFKVNVAEVEYVTGTMQTVLGQIQDRTQQVSQSLIAADLTPNDSLLTTLSEDAVEAMDQVLTSLNKSVAGRSLFAGIATDRNAVAGVDAVMAELETAVSGLTSLDDIDLALDAFFASGGTYDAVIYQGADTGLAPLQLSDTESANVDIRATDEVFRDILKPLALASLASNDALGYDTTLKAEMLSQSGRDLLGAQKPMVELRAGLGALEARVEETKTRIESERTSISIAKLNLVGADPYETATKYEEVRSQLESLYAITVRSQRLSLAEFL